MEFIHSKKKDSQTIALKENAWETIVQTFISNEKVSKRDKPVIRKS
jgi:hypothetical protein